MKSHMGRTVRGFGSLPPNHCLKKNHKYFMSKEPLTPWLHMNMFFHIWTFWWVLHSYIQMSDVHLAGLWDSQLLFLLLSPFISISVNGTNIGWAGNQRDVVESALSLNTHVQWIIAWLFHLLNIYLILIFPSLPLAQVWVGQPLPKWPLYIVALQQRGLRSSQSHSCLPQFSEATI